MAPHDSGKATIGIDIGATKCLYALFDDRFEALAREKLRTDPGSGGAKAFTRKMRGAVKELLREARSRGLEVRAAGVGCAGDIDLAAGVVRSSPNLAFLDDYSFRDVLGGLTGAPVFVANDVHSGLYGEMRLGSARKARHVIAVFVGTGVGGALAIDRKLHLGASGVAGNIGNYLVHAVASHEGPSQEEVLDAVASRSAIAGEAAALAAKRRAPTLRRAAGTDVSDIGSSDLAQAVAGGDKAVAKLVRARAGVLGAALSNLVDFLDPDLVVLGGGLVEAMPDLMRREVRRAIEAHASKEAARDVKVAVARLGDLAVAAGAACLARDVFSAHPPFELP